MERILVGVDLSESSGAALDTALALARTSGGEVEAVYVMAPQPPVTLWTNLPYLGPVADPALELELKQQFEAFVRERVEKQGDLVKHLTTRFLDGFEPRELLAEAARFEASLIVVGSHGRSALERFFLGSVSSKVLRRSKIPVLVVRGTSWPPARILAGLALGESTELVLQTAQHWQQLVGAKLSVAHVRESPPLNPAPNVALGQEVMPIYVAREKQIQASLEQAIEKVFPAESRPALRTLTGEPDKELSELARQDKADLIIVGPHEKHGIFDLGDTAMRLAHRCGCSLLVARPVASKGLSDGPDAGP